VNNRPSHEPTRNFDPARRLQADAARHPRSLGCRGCPDFAKCGGLNIEAEIFDCDDFCSCADPAKCDMVCRKKPADFFARVQEIDGFDLETIARITPCPAPRLPAVIPHVRHKYSRRAVLQEPCVAISLYELFHLRTGEPLVRSRAELASRFRIPDDAMVIASGVEKDFRVEAWWGVEDRHRLMNQLRMIGISLVTTPNFSLFTNVPRADNLHAMKRIALSWAELAAAGIPAALHVNARTEFDYARWAQFITKRSEIDTIAFEFGTGAGYPERIGWHVDQLRNLAKTVGRPLTLVLRGGTQVLAALREAYAHVVVIETQAFGRAIKRRRATITETGRLRWRHTPLAKGQPIDELFAHNIATMRAVLSASQPKVPSRLRALQKPLRSQAAHTDRETRQTSFLRELDAALQARAMPADCKGMIITAET